MRTTQGRFAAGQFFVGLLQPLFKLLAFGNVPENALDADALAGGIVDRSLDDVDVEPFTQWRFIFLDGLENFPGPNNVAIIALIFGGQFGRVKIEVGLADNLLERLAEHAAKAL